MTKRILSVILALILAMTAMVACGNKQTGDDTNNDANNENENVAIAENATELLSGTYDKFLTAMAPAFGVESADEIKGYFVSNEMETITETDPDSGEEFSYDMPKAGAGTLDLADVDTLVALTLFPADSIEKLDSASIFFNMMNQNNGTFTAFELKDAADVDAIVAALQTNITGNMWFCGFPERYVIIKVDNFVLAGFGLADGTNAFKDAIVATYEGAVVVHDAAL